MKVRNLIILILVAALLFAGAYTVFVGLEFGYKSFEPLRALSYDMNLGGGAAITYKMKEADEASVRAVISIMETRLQDKGILTYSVTREGEDRIQVNIPVNSTSKMSDAAQIADYLAETGNFNIRNTAGDVLIERSEIDDVFVYEDTLGKFVLYVSVKKDSIAKLQEAALEVKESNDPYIEIYLDDVELASVYVTSGIDEGTFGFDAGYTEYQANEAADLINSGMYPKGVSVFEEKDLGPDMGEAGSLFMAALGAAAAVAALYLILRYRIPGLLGSLSILFYLTLTAFLISLMRMTVTPWAFAAVGAGLILTVASQICIHSDIRKEFDNGKNIRASYRSGYGSASKTVLDLFAVLFFAFLVFVVSAVENITNFSYFLGVSIAVSYVSSVVVNRFLYSLVVGMAPEKTGLYFAARKVSAEGSEE